MSNKLISSTLQGKKVLITGGASGIGAEIAKQFLDAGAHVAILDINAFAIARKIGILSRVDIAFLGDVSNPNSVAEIFAQLDQCWSSVDVVINNAGISVSATLAETTIAVWNKVIGVNLTGTFLISQAAAKRMLQQGQGIIINIASVSGMVGMTNYLSYNVSKAGVIELTKTLAVELGPIVRVNAICPGYVLTPMQEKEYTKKELQNLAKKIPAKRLAYPREIATMAVYLASDSASFITGSAVVMDGGETAGGMASF